MAWATTRAFAKVKSSARMPRQPSVPNRIAVMECQYTRWAELGKQAGLAGIQQMFLLLFCQFFHDFADVMGALAGTNQQGIGGVHDDEVVNANGGDEFPG